MNPGPLGAAILLVIAPSSATGQAEDEVCDYQVCCAGDVDSDGTSDFLISRNGFAYSKDRPRLGSLYLCSFGKQHSVLARIVGENDDDGFGSSLAVIEPAGKSSEGHCLAGEPGFDEGRGRLLRLSNAKLERLRVIEGAKPGGGFGAKIIAPDSAVERSRVVLVSSEPVPSASGSMTQASIGLLSVETWTPMAEHAFTEGEKLGRSGLAWIPDQDSDGSSDVAVGIVNAMDGAGNRVGRVEIRSGKTLALLATIHGTDSDGEFGASITPIRVGTSLSRFDLLIGAPGVRGKQDSMPFVALSRWDLASKSVRPVFATQNFESRAGNSVVSVGDIDGDGHDDIASGAPRDTFWFDSDVGVTRILSGSSRAVIAEGFWKYDEGQLAPPNHGARLPLSGFGGRLKTYDIQRKGKPCSVLAVSTQSPMSWVEGVVFFDIARITKNERLEHAALWEAAFARPGLRLRTVTRK